MSRANRSPAPADGMVRTLQIIVLAMLMGTATFLGVVLFLSLTAWKPLFPVAGPGPVSLIGLGLAMVNGVLAVVVPRFVERNGLAQLGRNAAGSVEVDPETALGQLYQTKTIVGAALLEGAASFQLIALLIEGWVPSLVAALLLMAGILAHLPTAGKFAAWRERVERQARDEAAVRGLRR